MQRLKVTVLILLPNILVHVVFMMYRALKQETKGSS